MQYVCLRCGETKPTEIRNRHNASGKYAKYRAGEKLLGTSPLLRLQKTSGTRCLCGRCLEELVLWASKRDAEG